MLDELKQFSLDEQANWSDLKRTYMEQLKIWHPDRFGHDEELRKEGEERTKELNQLFNKLKSQVNELEKHGVKVQWDKPILPQLVDAGVLSFAQKPQEAAPIKPFEQEPLVGNKVNKVGSKERASDYEDTLWHPQIIAAALLSGVTLLASCFFIYKTYFEVKPPKVVYGPPADLSKFKKPEVEDTFAKELEASIGTEHLRSGDGIVEGQLGGARIISGVTDKSAENIPAVVKAASRCDLDEVQKLINKGAKVNAEDSEGMSPLSWAAKVNCDKLAKYLISKGADLNHVSANGFTPLAWARWFKNIEVIKTLEIDSRHIVKRP